MSAAGVGDLIELASCNLVPLDNRHSQYVVAWRNDPNNRVWFTTTHEFTVEGHEEWLARARSTGREFMWAIEQKDGSPIGLISLYNIDRATASAELGRILIGDEAMRGRGLAKEAIGGVLRFAGAIGLQKVYLVVIRSNMAAIGLYSRLGFKRVAMEDDVLHMEIENFAKT